ncbi:MAG: HAMP domain-containing protein [Spirochaetales bacterium]|nr:HAMP domain-containing protein [Spirochaetales bacterium]
MKLQQGASSTPTGLFVLIIFYIFLISLILIFSQQIIGNIQNINPFANLLIIIIIIILPLLLLGAIIVNMVTLFRERAKKKPGSRFKLRLIIFFVFVALLSLIPQALLSISFINSSINFWFSVKIIDVLDGGLQVALNYYSDKYENLKVFHKSPMLPSLLSDIETKPAQVCERLQSVNPEIDFIQCFDQNGNEIVFWGEQENGKFNDFAEIQGKNGMLPKKETGDLSILRSVSEVKLSNKTFYLVLGIILTEEFNAYASRITSSRSTFKQLEYYKDLFRIAVIIFYFVFSFPILLLAILISFLLTDEIIRPIVNLEEATRRVSEGDFSFRILARSNDELSILVESFNRMITELDASRKKLLHSEKITAWQEIAQRLAHEIKNPLTPIKLSAQRIQKKYKSGMDNFEQVLEPAISSIIREVDNLNNLLTEFKEFTRLPDLRFEEVSIRDILSEVADVYKGFSNNIRIAIDISKEADDRLKFMLDRTQMKQVFANLFKNAIQAMPDGGEIRVNGDMVKKGYNTYFRIQIKDTGDGIDDEIKEKIFDPYFTTKKDGTGLGLSIVERIIFDHKGNIWFESRKGIGTTFFIDLPTGAPS